MCPRRLRFPSASMLAGVALVGLIGLSGGAVEAQSADGKYFRLGPEFPVPDAQWLGNPILVDLDDDGDLDVLLPQNLNIAVEPGRAGRVLAMINDGTGAFKVASKALLVCPAAIIPAYPVEERYPGFSEGVPYADYYRWLAICCAITAVLNIA